MNDPRYPIGRPEIPAEVTPAIRAEWMEQLAAAPALVRSAIAGLDDAQLDTPYREGGWTVRQVVHHLADSHLHALLRFKFALLEPEHQVKVYNEKEWAAMEDAANGPVEPSLAILEGVHARWIRLLRSLGDQDFARTMHHPERGAINLDFLLGIYSWHGRHHAAQITALRDSRGW